MSESMVAALTLLPKEVLEAMQGMAENLINIAHAKKLDMQLVKQSMDVMLAPKIATANMMNNAIGMTKKVSNIIPSAIISKCPELGKTGKMLEIVLSSQMEQFNNILDDVNMLNSINAQDALEVAKLDEAIEFCQDLIQKVRQALSTLT